MSFRRYPSTSASISGNVNVQVLDANGNPILSTIDPYSLKNGLDVNLLESGIIGDVGQPLSAPYSDAAMAIAFNNGGTLQTPNMDVADGTLIVDVTQKGLGQEPMSNSLPVVIAFDQTPVSTNIATVNGAGLFLGQQVMAQSLPVVISSDQSKISTFLPDSATNGNITSTQSVTIACNGSGTVGAQISGTWTGTIIVEGSVNGVSWIANPSVSMSTGVPSSTYTSNEIIQINCSGLFQVRLRGNTVASGTAVISLISNQSTGVVMIENSIPAGNNVIGRTILTDGTNSAVVKPPSTAPVLADPAVVVSLSPNTASGGLSTSALQTTGNSILTSIDASATGINSKLPVSLGQKAMAQSLAVVLASDQSSVNTILPDLFITGQSAQTAVINNIIPATASANATDASGYRSGTIQIVSTGTAGTFIFEHSNDNVNFQTMPVYNQVILTGTPITSAITATASQIIYTFPIQARYIRLRIATLITGGSIQAFTRLSQASWSPAVMQVAQNTGTNLNTSVSSGTITTVSTVTAVTSITNNVNVKQVNSLGTFVRNDYTVTNVTTGAYVQLIASTAAAYNAIEIFDSSGQTLQIALGASASEVNQFLILPGGNGRIPYTIAAASRVSVRAVSGTANVGELSINFYV